MYDKENSWAVHGYIRNGKKGEKECQTFSISLNII